MGSEFLAVECVTNQEIEKKKLFPCKYTFWKSDIPASYVNSLHFLPPNTRTLHSYPNFCAFFFAMKRRQLLEAQSWFLICLVVSASVFVPAYASPRPQQKSRNLDSSPYQYVTEGADYVDYGKELVPDVALEQYRHLVETGRQDDIGSIGSLISIGIKVVPLLLQAFNAFSGSGSSDSSSSSSSSSNTVDRVETAAAANDPFSWSNLISMGIKVALALVSSYTSDGIDKSDAISPTQAVLGTIISALTGSEDPKEVATFAKQADEVFGLVQQLGNAVFTSLTS